MTRSNDLEVLRRAAEGHLKHRCALAEAEAADVSRLLHELRVHQSELEMQNSELLETRGQLEAALAGYTELYDFAPVGYFTLDRRGVIQQLNLAAAHLLEDNRSALTGRAFSDFVEPDHQAAFADALHRAVIGANHEHCELALVRKSSAETPLFVHIELAPNPNQPDATLRAVVVDITQARLAQEALLKHQETFRAIMSASPDLVYYVDRRFAIQYINRVPAGLDIAAVMGTDATAYVAPEYQSMVRQTLHDVFETGRTGRFEVLARGEHDRPTWYETIVAPVFNGTDVLYATLLSRDITERVEAAQRHKALSQRLVGAQEAARRHLAGELHDRTSANLAALGINFEVAEMALKSGDWQEVGARMHDNRALVQDTEASIREICAELRPPALDYAGLAPAIEAYASQFSRRTGIAVRLECSQTAIKLPAHLESTLFRIVQEALNNVAKHAAAKAVNVTLQLDRETVRLSVSDDGIGFDPVRQSETGGQGIITMREMAEFIGAGLELLTRPGNGVRISVAIPCAEQTT